MENWVSSTFQKISKLRYIETHDLTSHQIVPIENKTKGDNTYAQNFYVHVLLISNEASIYW
jgi:hypothetical protein